MNADRSEYQKRYYRRHRMSLLARRRAERLADPEGHRLYRSVYRSQNRQRIRQMMRAWERHNRERRRAYHQVRYRSRKKQRSAL